ncbi:MAG: 50S ribosomal protein L17 [Anaerolineae bacterium]|nr:50S ribosomal protein L17 [Anaerolineae bacterium]
MPHQVYGRHLGRSVAQRRSLFRALMTDLFRYDRIKTTEAKAKAIKPEAERLITRAKKGEPGRLVSLAQAGNVRQLTALLGATGANRLLSIAKTGDAAALETAATQTALHNRRVILSTIRDQAVVDRLIHDVAAQHLDRPGGYTRIIKLGPRQGDAAPMVFLEIV